MKDEMISKKKFQPGDKFILEIGEKRMALDEYEIVGTDLWVWGSLLEKLTPYELDHSADVSKKVDADLISRRGAIDALCAVCGKACDKSEFVYNAPQDEQVILCPEHYCLCTLPPAQSEQQWISVSERLPEDGLYLVTTSKGQVQVHVFSHNGNSEEYWMRCNKAWMPLPEPYRGE